MARTGCGSCGKLMNEELQSLFGEKVRMDICSCGKQLVNVKDLARLQRKVMPRLHEIRVITTAGSSSAVTIPKQLSRFFKKGDEVSLNFDPKRMELRIKKIA